MDKIEKMANNVFHSVLSDDEVYSTKMIAAFGRECAAQAFEEAALEPWGPDHGERLLGKAASLRSSSATRKVPSVQAAPGGLEAMSDNWCCIDAKSKGETK